MAYNCYTENFSLDEEHELEEHSIQHELALFVFRAIVVRVEIIR